MTYGARGLLGHIDLALAQTLDQIFRREIDDLDIVGLVEDAVGNRFPHANPGDPGDDVVQALDMLDVERRKHIDPDGNDLLDIEIALGMPAAWGVGVGELVDENKLRPAPEDRVEIHFGEQVTLVLDLLPRNYLEAFEQGLGLMPAMSLDHADDDIDPVASPSLSRQQHLIGLADAGCCAQKDL